jgi:outer membrane usher protein FimD/PapC
VLGDTTTRNSIGFQNSFSGVGISIFRQSGDGNVVNSSSPIVITRLSKIECKLGNDVLATRVYAPGVYYLDDLVEEAKIPGVTLKISDQLNRSDVLTINYFSGYNGLKKGENDFDVTALYHHKWDVDDPHRLKYCKNPYLSTNYRYGISDDITVGVGLQQRKESYQLDGISVFSGEFGMISPNISFSSSSPSQRKSVKALGAGLFYALPQNSLGISFETYFAVKGKGFGDLGTADDMNESYNKFMDKYLNDANLRQRFANSSSDEVSKQIAARIYSKPICGITPAFIFSGQWTDSKRLREYTLSFTTKLFNRITITASAGLTYDDPYKGINRESPDRRLTVACTIPVGDFEISGTYSHHDDDRLRSYAKIAYTPSEIKGLEITLERDTKPGFSSPSVAIKYDGDHFDAKFDEGIKNTYADRLGTRSAAHSNQQRFFFGTSISPSGFKSYQKSSFNVLRSAKTTKK